MEVKILILLLFGICSRTDASSWGYGTDDGPGTWGVDYEVCAGSSSTARQSPIDLTPMNLVQYNDLVFNERWNLDVEGELYDNGHTVEFEVAQPNNLTVTGGPFGEEEFQFLQLHFHWGSNNDQGSEHTVAGVAAAMEMHMVHINSKYVGADGTLDSTYSTEADGVAVLGFMFYVDPWCGSYYGCWDYEPLTNVIEGIAALSGEEVGTVLEEVELNLGKFLLSVEYGGYFSYDGSFTTPACNEVVTWLNYATPIFISQDQLDAYRTLKDSDGYELADNFRPVQSLNGRTISYTRPSFLNWITW